MSEGASSEGGDRVSRRGFVGWAMGLGTGFVALVGGIPLIGELVGGTPQAKLGPFVRVAHLDSLPPRLPTSVTFVEETEDAYEFDLLPHSVWVIKRSEEEVVVFSPVCPHLGCQVFFDHTSNEFKCPCHGSVFSLDGKVLAGPAPRPLDMLPIKVKDGALYVQWVQYKPDTAMKIPV